MKRLLALLMLCIALLSAAPASAILEEDMYGSDTEFGVDYGGPSHGRGRDSMADLMPNGLGCLAFLATGYIAWALARANVRQDKEESGSIWAVLIACGAFAPLSMFCVKHLGPDQNLVWFGILGYAGYLFWQRRKETQERSKSNWPYN